MVHVVDEFAGHAGAFAFGSWLRENGIDAIDPFFISDGADSYFTEFFAGGAVFRAVYYVHGISPLKKFLAVMVNSSLIRSASFWKSAAFRFWLMIRDILLA